jgi:signal transduction histidine kinase
VAVAIRHEVNNALAAIVAEGQLLEMDARITHPEDKQSLDNIMMLAHRVRDSIEILTRVSHAPVTDYSEGVRMIDLAKLRSQETEDLQL